MLGEASSPHVRGLRDGGAPWLLSYPGDEGTPRNVVLRVAPADRSADETQRGREVLGMNIARTAGVPVPAVLASEVTDTDSTVLIEFVDGTSILPPEPDVTRLEAIGAMAARVSACAADPRLPIVTHPIPSVDFAALRGAAPPQPLLAEAERRTERNAPRDAIGFTHGDLWSGNTLWRNDRIVAVIDWDCAGRGPDGIDLGSLRCDAAMCYAGDAAGHVLAGWERQAGHRASSVPYWDVIAALSTPPDISWFAAAITGMTGRPDLTAALLRERRDAFLENALERLDAS